MFVDDQVKLMLGNPVGAAADQRQSWYIQIRDKVTEFEKGVDQEKVTLDQIFGHLNSGNEDSAEYNHLLWQYIKGGKHDTHARGVTEVGPLSLRL